MTTRVHQGAIDVLGTVLDPQTVHQSKFSMGTVLALIAVHGRAGLLEFDQHFRDLDVVVFRNLVEMELDPEVDAAYPSRWIGKVTIETRDGRVFDGRVDEPKGDPGNTLNRAEVEQKTLRLANYRGGSTDQEMRTVIQRVWSLAEAKQVGWLLPSAAGPIGFTPSPPSTVPG